MYKNKITIFSFFIIVTAVAIFLGNFGSSSPPPNAQSVLQNFVAQSKFEPFDVPRANWGVGTVISFNEDGSDNIIWKNRECLKLVHQKSVGAGEEYDIETTAISLPTSRYVIDKNATLEFSLAKIFSPTTNVKAALQDSRVAHIEIDFSNPVTDNVSDGVVEAKIKQLSIQNNACVDKIFEPGVYMIDEVISLTRFSYRFLDKQNDVISLDAGLVNKMNVASSASQAFIGSSELQANDSRYIGFKLFQYQLEGGMAEAKIVATRVAPNEARARARNGGL